MNEIIKNLPTKYKIAYYLLIPPILLFCKILKIIEYIKKPIGDDKK